MKWGCEIANLEVVRGPESRWSEDIEGYCFILLSCEEKTMQRAGIDEMSLSILFYFLSNKRERS